jgi:Tol biopolymer transport system component
VEKTQAFKKIISGLLFTSIVLGILILMNSCNDYNDGTDSDINSIGYTVKSIATIKEYGKSLDWSSKNNRILSAAKQTDGYYDVFVMNPDGGNQSFLTHNKIACPQKHNGNPVWHPSGEYIVFTAENEDTPEEDDIWAIPGRGINCNLWAMTADGEKFFQLTDYPHSAPEIGVIHPQFSRDGQKLFWAERRYYGNSFGGGWILKLADFIINDKGPGLKNIINIIPGQWNCFYESHDFSYDDKWSLFSGNLLFEQLPVGLDIYEHNINGKELRRLTESDDDWDEHAHYSPDNTKIAWMSSSGFLIEWGDITGINWSKYLVTELWLMNYDGSQKQRITFFNEPGYPEYMGGRRIIVSDSSWGPDGNKIIVCIAYSSLEDRETIAGSKIVMIEFE